MMRFACVVCMMAALAGCISLKPIAEIDRARIEVSASSWEQKAHGGVADFPPQLTLDGDMSVKSSWRAEGHGQWIRYDLGRTVSLRQIGIAFFKGNERTYTFEILGSRTGEENDWQPLVEKRQSSGTSPEMEFCDIETAKVRYVKIVGYGNTNKEFALWFNIIETSFMAR